MTCSTKPRSGDKADVPLSLPMGLHVSLVGSNENFNLSFEDAYQYAVARHYGLKIVTMDKDFEKVSSGEVLFL